MSTVRKAVGVRARRFSKAEYYRMAELGFFHGQKVELIEGRLMVQSPQTPRHSTGVYKATKALELVFTSGFIVRAQFPIDLGQTTEPEPDLAVVAGPYEQYEQAHPTTVALLVEVSETTLSYDRKRKGSLYARAGVADYWVLNLVKRQVEVYRDPVPDPTQLYGHRYSSRTDVPATGTVSPLAAPSAKLAAAALLP